MQTNFFFVDFNCFDVQRFPLIQCTFDGSGPFLPEVGTAIRIPTDRLPLEPVNDLVVSLSCDSLMEHVELSWSPAQCAHAYYVYKSTTGPEGTYNYLGFTPATTFIDDDAISVYNTSFYYVTAEDDPTDAGIALQPIPNRIQSPTIQPQNPQKKAPNPAMIKSRR